MIKLKKINSKYIESLGTVWENVCVDLIEHNNYKKSIVTMWWMISLRICGLWGKRFMGSDSDDGDNAISGMQVKSIGGAYFLFLSFTNQAN